MIIKKRFFIVVFFLLLIGVPAFFICGKKEELFSQKENYMFDKIEIDKSERVMRVFSKGQVVREYSIDLGFNPIGHKEKEGDGRTPEGLYKIELKNPKSRFHLSLKVSYPNTEDKENARKKGVAPGGDIMIHGLPNKLPSLAKFLLGKDWTKGCIAVMDNEIEEIYAATPVGTPVEIKP